ncbi:MAG: hypothetical protein ACE5D1_02285 [Fidelibacterota bacterium]
MSQEKDYRFITLPEVSGIPDKTAFINRLHDARLEADVKRMRFISAIQAVSMLLVVGYLSFSGLSEDRLTAQTSALAWEKSGLDDSLRYDYEYDLALYLIDQSEDIYSTVEFLESVDYQPLTALLEEYNE